MNVHHLAVTAHDLKESIKFYQDLFGFQEVKSFERPDLQARAVWLSLNNFILELWQFSLGKDNVDDLQDIKIKGIRHLAFEVDNLDKILLDLNKKGIIAKAPQLGASGHRYSFISDPNGVALELIEA